MGEPEERIVMTPKKKTANSTCLAMERRAVEAARKTSLHVAGGEHSGIVINKVKTNLNFMHSLHTVHILI